MAVMHPGRFPEDRARMPRFEAERRVWDALRAQLGERCHVFYSAAFLDQNPDGSTRDAEADFIIVDPSEGVMCLEVKGGHIEYSDETGRFYSTDRSGRRHSIRSPKDQARRAKHHLIESLPRALAAWGDVPRVFVCTAVCFPDAFRAADDEFPDIDPREAIYHDDLDRLAAAIPAIFAFHRGDRAGPSLGNRLVRAAGHLLEPPSQVGSPTAVHLTAAEGTLFELTSQQSKILSGMRFSQRFALAGGPGTGKTVIAFEQAKWLASQGRRTLLTCFNRLLADRLAENARAVTNLKVSTFYRLATEAFGDRAFDEDGKLILANEPKSSFDAVVVDEGQNFHSEWWLAIESMLHGDESVLNVFYDPNQEIYEGTNAFPDVFGDAKGSIAPPGWNGYLLTDNVRNTSPIIAVASRACESIALPDNGVDGEQVILICANEKDAAMEVARELQRLSDDGIPAREIAVLCAWPTDAVDRFIAKVRPHTKAACSREPGDCVLFETVRRFQGLDAGVVILVGLDSVFDNQGATLVAITRARSRLTIVATEDLCRIFGAGAPDIVVEFRERKENKPIADLQEGE